MNIYSSFSHNYPKLETTKQPNTDWINKLWYIHIFIMKYYSAIKKEKKYMHNIAEFKSILLSGRSQVEKLYTV